MSFQTWSLPHSERIAEGENKMQGPRGRIGESNEYPQMEKTGGLYSEENSDAIKKNFVRVELSVS